MSDSISNLLGIILKFPMPWILTGAGISTESGIPDFRSPGTGLWEKVDPMVYSSVEGLLRDPKAFFSYGRDNIVNVLQAQPNTGHVVLGNLQQLGMIGPIVTQNIDDLHRRGGSDHFYEVHGHFRSASCMNCSNQLPMDELINKLDQGEIPPLCWDCGGILKPDVVLFGDMMPSDYQEASLLANTCQTVPKLMIVIGSSLTVSPVNYLPLEFNRIVIINNTPTETDYRAELVIREQIGPVMGKLWEEILDLNEGQPPDPLPPGFNFGIMVAYLDNEVRFLQNQKFRPSVSLDSLSKHFGVVQSDIKTARSIIAQSPLPPRQPLERAILDFYLQEINRMEYEIDSLLSFMGIPFQDEQSRLPKLISDYYNESLRALTTYTRQENVLPEIAEKMAVRAAGNYDFWSSAHLILGLAPPAKEELEKLKKIVSDRGVKADLQL
ncbi:MAG: hypothetical protein GXY50_06735 [Syntrophomonadaceae bacterium]|nr:hypothetical protein [Syntrophomonadaceae bacterium]